MLKSRGIVALESPHASYGGDDVVLSGLSRLAYSSVGGLATINSFNVDLSSEVARKVSPTAAARAVH